MANAVPPNMHPAAQKALDELKAKKAERDKHLNEIAKKRNKRLTINLIMLTVVLTMLAIAFGSLGNYYFAMLMGVGLLPGLVAYVTDSRQRRLASKTVIALNLAGLFPTIVGIVVSGTPEQASISALSNPQVWLMMYGFAALGWGLVYVIPHIYELYLEIRADFMVKKLTVRQEELVEEWGDAVTGQTPNKPKSASSVDDN